MNQHHFDILKLGVQAWNDWREAHPEITPNLSGALLAGLVTPGINFTRTDLSRAMLFGARLSKSMLIGANLNYTVLVDAVLDDCYFSGNQLYRTSFNGASLHSANFMRATLTGVDLSHADLAEADFRFAKLEQVNLEFAKLTEVNFSNASMNTCLVYGITADQLEIRGIQLQDLVVSNHEDPTVTVDNLEVAQRLFTRIREVDTAINSGEAHNLAMVAGNFQRDRRQILTALRQTLESRNLLPVVVHIDKPIRRGFLDMVRQVALFSRFIIADVTCTEDNMNPFLEMLPQLRVPLQPIVAVSQSRRGVVVGMENHPWVLKSYSYRTPDEAAAALVEHVIDPIEQKGKELEARRG